MLIQSLNIHSLSTYASLLKTQKAVMKIYAFHLLNDYSGSPKVLMQLAKGWTQHGLEVNIVTCSGREGFLSNLEGMHYHHYWYRFAQNPLLRLFNLVWSQCLLIVQLLNKVQREDIIYINTVLPFGAALLGKLKGCRIIYHVHETTVRPAIFKRFLFGMLHWAADDVIFVSNFLAEQEPAKRARQHILHNAIEDDFLGRAINNRRTHEHPKHVLMVCSLKEYKGVHEFVQLAQDLPHLQFRMVMNAKQADIDSFFEGKNLPHNLVLFPTQTDLHDFYRWSDVILNLSRPDGWVETFGLTIIEGMAYGLPAIVPPVGGITELVEEGINGFKVDSRKRKILSTTLKKLLENPAIYHTLTTHSIQKIQTFSEATFIEKSLTILESYSMK